MSGRIFSAKNYTKTAVSTGPEDKADGFSVWGSVKPVDKIAIFARYDSAKPSKDLNPNRKDTYYNMGVSYQARKNVDLAMVYKHDKVVDYSSTVNERKTDEVGLWAQVKF